MKNGMSWGDMETNGRVGSEDQSTGDKGLEKREYHKIFNLANILTHNFQWRYWRVFEARK